MGVRMDFLSEDFAKYLLGDTTADHYGNIEEYKGIEN